MNKLEKLHTMQDAWFADRPTIAQDNANITRLIQLLMSEVLELQAEWNNGGDSEKMKSEMADIGWFLFALLRQFDTDIFEEMREKMALNMLRYDWRLFQDGEYNEARKEVKKRETPIIKEFYGEE